jgi:uncharacterized membrane protein (UPF0127 family)
LLSKNNNKNTYHLPATFKLFPRQNSSMARKTAVLIPVIVAASAIGILGVAFAPHNIMDKSITLPKGTVRINDDVITVEIASTAAERERWLTFRNDILPLNTAMLLKYDKPDLQQIWMLNIQHNLDLIWLDQNNNVIYMKKDVPPCTNLVETVSCTYKSTKPALYVIAASSGFVDKHKVDLGSKMTIISV